MATTIQDVVDGMEAILTGALDIPLIKAESLEQIEFSPCAVIFTNDGGWEEAGNDMLRHTRNFAVTYIGDPIEFGYESQAEIDLRPIYMDLALAFWSRQRLQNPTTGAYVAGVETVKVPTDTGFFVQTANTINYAACQFTVEVVWLTELTMEV